LPGPQDPRTNGNKAEDAAARYLEKHGYSILCRNYRARTSEIDIIARDGAVLVFVEVKSRSYSDFGSPWQAVNSRKQDKIRKAALDYIIRSKLADCPARFDVISIVGETVEHIRDAFEIT
jgi:putative endonuclease